MDALDLIEKRESGGRNIFQQLVPLNVSSASGNFQMINPTWHRWAQGAGVDISRWPRAIDAPYDVQRQVANYGFKTEGFKPWEATKNLVGHEGEYSGGTRMAPDYMAPRTGGPGERSLNGILDERFQPSAPPRSGPSGERALASGALDERYQPEMAPQAAPVMLATPDLTNGGSYQGLGGLLAKVFAQNQAAQAPQPQLYNQKQVNLANILGGASPNLVIGAQNA